MKRILSILAIAILFSSSTAFAQKERKVENRSEESKSHARFALSTNLVDYLYLVTPNLDLQLAVASRWSLWAGGKYNNWSFNYGDPKEVKNRQQTYWLGFRYWPWYTYSEWYFGAAAQYQEYDRGGLFRSDSEAGTAVGLVLYGGYALHVTKWFNIDFGVGFWGGRTNYSLYDCPYCGKKIEEGHKFFILPNEARIALEFIF